MEDEFLVRLVALETRAKGLILYADTAWTVEKFPGAYRVTLEWASSGDGLTHMIAFSITEEATKASINLEDFVMLELRRVIRNSGLPGVINR